MSGAAHAMLIDVVVVLLLLLALVNRAVNHRCGALVSPPGRYVAALPAVITRLSGCIKFACQDNRRTVGLIKRSTAS